MRILLVEDDPMIGEAVLVALKDAAYAVDWVRDGAAASNTLTLNEHQALLLDLGLPSCDGLEVLRRLRAAGKVLPVVIITARDDVASRVQGLDCGADDYLVKPLDIRELRGRVTRWIWIHSTNSRISGTAMCRKTSSVKKRLERLAGLRKLRAIGSPKIGKRSSSSVEVVATYWASVSQTSQ